MRASLAEEIGKSQPFQSPTQEAFLNVMRTAGALESEFKALFRRYRLSSTTYNLLRILRGHRPHGCRCSDIREQLVVRVPDVTRLVNGLIDSGLVTRKPDADDGRAVLIQITRKGLRLLQKLDEPVLQLHRAQLGHLSIEELASLNTLLEKARHRAG